MQGEHSVVSMRTPLPVVQVSVLLAVPGPAVVWIRHSSGERNGDYLPPLGQSSARRQGEPVFLRQDTDDPSGCSLSPRIAHPLKDRGLQPGRVPVEGDLVAPLDLGEARELTSEIREAIKAVRTATGRLAAAVRRAHEARVWGVLGYPTWKAYARAEFEIGRTSGFTVPGRNPSPDIRIAPVEGELTGSAAGAGGGWLPSAHGAG
ncbi:hypothetical protein [Streptomyces brasiliscabiei]|uniref:hypothetical protein n=1 Tax=Streptomyces brasiliscabiei TaxID=2736302 RepID=UPI001C112D25|nr:hypothetical protein [Streptomyces brasiliscabiei]